MRAKRLLIPVFLILIAGVGYAEESAALKKLTQEVSTKVSQNDGNIIWTLLAAFLVFFMQAGFAMVEAGFTRAKNSVNIIMKNLLDFAAGTLAFWIIGFGLMFGLNSTGLLGEPGFFFDGFLFKDGKLNEWAFAFIIFQTVFAATAATIVSGGMAERTKFKSYIIYSVIVTALIYPIFGSWTWNGLFSDSKGWLEALGFIDFAGSTVVHSIGGWLALAGAIVLGPRLGKYVNGKPKPIPGHNIPLAALGVFILWFGWFGFNPGSTTTMGGQAAVVAVTTNIAAAAGTIMALIFSWIKFKKADAGMTLNGALAGLVAITAGCANVSPFGAFLIGSIAGIIVVFSVLLFDKIGVDDPVGAISVHGVCGAWGTLAVGLFASKTYGGVDGLFYGGSFKILGVQFIGVLSAFIFAFGLGYAVFKLIDKTVGLRVSRKEEVEGLDLHEHGSDAYANFRITHN